MYQYLVENLKKIEYKLFCSQCECSRKATYEARSEKQKNDESKEDVGLDFVYTEARADGARLATDFVWRKTFRCLEKQNKI